MSIEARGNGRGIAAHRAAEILHPLILINAVAVPAAQSIRIDKPDAE